MRSGRVWLGLAIWLGCVAAGTARAAVTNLTGGVTVGLDYLLAGNQAVVGDKFFADFTLAGSFSATQIQVSGIQDSFGYGIRFSGPFTAVGAEEKDLVLQFSVLALADGFFISDVHLRYNGSFKGNGFTEIIEQVFSNDPTPPPDHPGVLLGQIEVSNPPQVLEATLFISPQKKIWIVKDVLLDANGTGLDPSNRATISVIDQTFSQIPEPGTAVLTALAVVALGLLRRCR